MNYHNYSSESCFYCSTRQDFKWYVFLTGGDKTDRDNQIQIRDMNINPIENQPL